MTARRSGKQPQRDPTAVVAAFTYFETSDLMGGDAAFTLALDSALDRLEAACRCQTWGEFARLAGYTWKDFVEDWAGDLDLVFEEKRPRASAPFVDFVGTWGTDNLVTGLIPDPRQCAYDVLVRNVPQDVLHHPRLAGVLDWEVSSPGGGIDAVTSEDPRGFEVFADVLHDAGFTGLTLKRALRPLIFNSEGG